MEVAISAHQQDSQARIERYQRLKDEAMQSGNATLARKWTKEVTSEQKNLAVIKRVEALNESGELEGWLRQFRDKLSSKELVAV